MTHAASRFTAVAAVLVLALGLAPSPTLASTGDCASAKIEEPFVLPDGSEHPAGRLTLCLGSEFTPVTSFYRTSVDRMPVGSFASRRIVGGDPTGRYMIFDRNAAGTLRLTGYTVPANGSAATFLLQRPARVQVRHAVRAALAEPTPAQSFIRIAAAAD